jgi:hypothetical protein
MPRADAPTLLGPQQHHLRLASAGSAEEDVVAVQDYRVAFIPDCLSSDSALAQAILGETRAFGRLSGMALIRA